MTDLRQQLRAMPSSLNDACRTMEAAADQIDALMVIEAAARAYADMHVVGWGAQGKLPEALRGRWKDIVRIADRVGCRLHCIGTCDDGHPRHPLMTGYDTPLTEWKVPWFANREHFHSP